MAWMLTAEDAPDKAHLRQDKALMVWRRVSFWTNVGYLLDGNFSRVTIPDELGRPASRS